MCELFAVCGKRKIVLNDVLKEFFSHSVEHENGWGIASFHGESVSVEKEPERAKDSAYLKNKLRAKIEEDLLLAHIRRATVGSLVYENCHPFVKRDARGRTWTLIHNGTIFNSPILNDYARAQVGSTDSERILLFFVDRLDREFANLDRKPTFDERFAVLERAIDDVAEGNKVNLLFYDGEYLYAHSNYPKSLFVCETPDGLLFATKPLDLRLWSPIPFTALCAYRAGELVKRGARHGKVFIDNPDEMKYLFMDFAGL